MLKPVPEVTRLALACGPTAIAAVTGLPVEDVLAAAHRYMGRPWTRPIVGMQDVQITGTLALLGFRTTIETWHNGIGGLPTFRNYTVNMPRVKRPVIVRFSEHVAAVTYDEYLCTKTEGQPVPIAQAPYQRARLWCVFGVEPL